MSGKTELSKRKVLKEERLKAQEFLKQRYPNAFLERENIKPFKIGFGHELIEDVKDKLPLGVSIRAIFVVIRYYTFTKWYKRARVTLGTPRIDLNGEISGEVTEEDIKKTREINKKGREERERVKQILEEQEENRRKKEERKAAQEAKAARRKAHQEAEAKAKERMLDGLKEMSLRAPKRKTRKKKVVLPTPEDPMVVAKSKEASKPKEAPKVIVKKKRVLSLKKLPDKDS